MRIAPMSAATGGRRVQTAISLGRGATSLAAKSFRYDDDLFDAQQEALRNAPVDTDKALRGTGVVGDGTTSRTLNIIRGTVWLPSYLGMALGVLALLHTIASLIAMRTQRSVTNCQDFESHCDPQVDMRIILLVIMKFVLVFKVSHYAIYDIDPSRLSRATDGCFGAVRPLATRVGLATFLMGGGVATVPFFYIFRLRVVGVVLIGCICCGLVLCVALWSLVDRLQGNLTTGGAMARAQWAAMACCYLGALLSFAAATPFGYTVAGTFTADSYVALLLELIAQVPGWLGSVMCWRRGAVITNPNPPEEEDDYGAGDGFMFNDIRSLGSTRPHLAVLAAGCEGVPTNLQLAKVAIPGDPNSSSSEGSDSESDDAQEAEAKAVRERLQRSWSARLHRYFTDNQRQARSTSAVKTR